MYPPAALLALMAAAALYAQTEVAKSTGEAVYKQRSMPRSLRSPDSTAVRAWPDACRAHSQYTGLWRHERIL
jgi:hypothetical protein